MAMDLRQCDLYHYILDNLRVGHQSLESTGHALFPDASKCTQKAWRENNFSFHVRVRFYKSLHIFLFLILRWTFLFTKMRHKKATEKVLFLFFQFLKLPRSNSPIAWSFQQFSKVTLFDADLKKSIFINRHPSMFHLLFQAISLCLLIYSWQ